MFEHVVELEIPRVRVACPQCGPKVELLGWLDPYARVTKHLAETVSRLCAVMSIRHVADYFGLDWKTVKDIDQCSLERRLGPVGGSRGHRQQDQSHQLDGLRLR